MSERKIVEFTYYWANKLGVRVITIKFRKYPRSLANAFSINWTPTPSGEITYHKRISKILTRKQQYYIALHEVAHLITPRIHSKEWKAMMTKHMPGWRKIDKKIDKAVWKNRYYNRSLK